MKLRPTIGCVAKSSKVFYLKVQRIFPQKPLPTGGKVDLIAVASSDVAWQTLSPICAQLSKMDVNVVMILTRDLASRTDLECDPAIEECVLRIPRPGKLTITIRKILRKLSKVTKLTFLASVQDEPPLSSQVVQLFKDNALDIGSVKAILLTDIVDLEPLNKRIYQVHHGSLPSPYGKRCFEHSDVFFGLCDEEEEYVSSGANLSKTEFVTSGSPKVDRVKAIKDRLLADKPSVSTGLAKLTGYETGSGKKVVVITSHWASQGILRKYNKDIIELADEFRKQAHFVFTAHPKLFDSSPKDPDFDSKQVSRFVSDVAAFGFYFHKGNSIDLFQYADVVIGDDSSIMAEAAVFDFDILCDRSKPIPVKTINDAFSSMIYSFDCMSELRKALAEVLRNGGEKQEFRKKFVDMAYPKIGRSVAIIAGRIAADIGRQ